MSNPIEPLPSTPNGHAGGDIASEELVGHGHFVTHFDEPSLDYSVSETKITETTLEEMRSIASRYPQARSALLPMLHLVQSVEGRVTPAGIEACAKILGLTTAEVSAGAEVQSTRGARVCTWKEAERVLAGFPDGRADEGPAAAGPSLLGLRIAQEHGWKAPDPEHVAERQDEESQ